MCACTSMCVPACLNVSLCVYVFVSACGYLSVCVLACGWACASLHENVPANVYVCGWVAGACLLRSQHWLGIQNSLHVKGSCRLLCIVSLMSRASSFSSAVDSLIKAARAGFLALKMAYPSKLSSCCTQRQLISATRLCG